MLGSAHTDLPGYLAALRNPSTVPVLGDACSRLGELSELLGDGPAGEPGGPAGGVLVVVPPGSAAAPVGAALAERVSGTFVECAPGDLSAGAAEAAHVVLAGLADELTVDSVFEALDATGTMRRDGRGEAALGVLLGRTPDELSWLIAKGIGCGLRVPPAHSQLCVAPWGEQEREDSTGTHWVVGADVRAEVVAPLLDRRHGLVSFAVAGREHGLVLSDTVVCGADLDPAEHGVASAASPGCAFSGQCFRPGVGSADVIRAREIRADVVFANSCMSWRPGHGLVAADYQLTNAFQRGIAAAFIGAVHRMVPDARLNRLAHRAAAAGASAGQLGILLNRQAAGREVPHYLVLGLPWVVPIPAAGPVPLEHLAPLLAEAAPAGDDTIRARLRQAGRALTALRDLPLSGFLPAGDLTGLDARVSAVVAGLKRDPSVLRADADGESAERLLELVADAEFDVALDLHDFGQVSESSLNEVWEDYLETTAVSGTGRCPYCGGSTATVTGRHPAHPRLQREVQACHLCGPVLDLPAGSPIRTITLDCPSVWPRPGLVEVGVTLALTEGPERAESVTAAVAVQVARATAHGLVVPEPQRVRLEPGSPARLRAEVEVEEHAFVHHEHVVRAVVVAGGQVHAAARQVAVWPRG